MAEMSCAMRYVEGPRGQQAPGGVWFFFALRLEESRVIDMLFGVAMDGDTVGSGAVLTLCGWTVPWP